MAECPKPSTVANNAGTKAVPYTGVARVIILNNTLTVVTEQLMEVAKTNKSERLQAAIDLLVQASEELSYVIDPE